MNREYITLYHGTSENNMYDIIEHGLLPRRYTNICNYKKFPSNEDFVYLTEYAAFNRAKNALKEKENGAIFRVKIFEFDKLYPDEDYIKRKKHIKYDKININNYKNEWKNSLDVDGCVAHKGAIWTTDVVIVPYNVLINTKDTYYNYTNITTEKRAEARKKIEKLFYNV